MKRRPAKPIHWITLAALVLAGGVYLFPVGDRDDAGGALHDAARRGDVQTVAALLADGADPGAPGEFGAQPLHGAAANGHEGVARLLLDAGADPDAAMAANGWTPLYWALDNGHLPMIELLLEAGADPVQPVAEAGPRLDEIDTPLHRAAAEARIEALKLMLAYGAGGGARAHYGWTPLHLACFAASEDAVRLLVQHGADVHARDEAGQTPMHAAVAVLGVGETDRRRLAIIDFLIEQGADINARDERGAPPVFNTWETGSPETLRVLAERGADLRATSNSGWTLLHVVANSPRRVDPRHPGPFGAKAYVEFLLDRGLDPAATNAAGVQPVHYAAGWANTGLLRLLVEHGADLHALDGAGRSALHWAAACRHASFEPCATIRELLDAGLDVNAADDRGRTPLHRAARDGNEVVIECLLEHGADPDVADAEGRTPGEVAGEMGHAAAAELLED